MAVELLACARPALASGSSLPALALGGFGNGLALVHDRLLLSHAAPPNRCTAACSRCRRRCVSLAFAISFVGARRADRRSAASSSRSSLSGLGLLGVIGLASPAPARRPGPARPRRPRPPATR